jgi:putative membrane-bound dehydrogenase-like protein
MLCSFLSSLRWILAASVCASLAAAPVDMPAVLDPRLELELFCREPDIVTPVAIDVDEHGRVWVIESNTHFPKPGYSGHASDRVLVIEDLDRDGRADRFTVFADGLEHAMALALCGEGRLLLATRRDVLLLEDQDGDGRAEKRSTLARLETREQYPHNGLTGFAAGEGGEIFFALGENMGAEHRLIGSDGAVLAGAGEGGSIYRMRADGSGLERWATGFWNTFHLATDAFGNLFAVDNDPDSRPPCRLLHIIRGGDYGYRRWLGRKGLHPFSSWNGEIPGTLPMVSGTGEAPSGVLAYEHVGLPEEYYGCLFATSWGDHRLDVYRLERSGASFRSHPEPVVRGGEMFRPVGVATAPDGSLYFSDWVDRDYHVHQKGRIWRLRAKEPPGDAPPPSLSAEPSLEEVLAIFSHPVRSVREKAAEALAAKPRAAELAAAALRQEDRPRAQYQALVVLGRLLDGREKRTAAAAGAAFAPEVEAARGRILGLAGRNVSPPQLLEGLLALDVLPPLEEVRGILLTDDPFLQTAAIDLLARLARGETVIELSEDAEPRVRLGALLALRRMGGAGRGFVPFGASRVLVPPSHVAAFFDDEDPAVRRAALQWAGEERLVEISGSLERALARRPLTRELLDAFLAARSLIDGESPDARDAQGRDQFLFGLSTDAGRPAALRALALRSITSGFQGWNAESAKALLESEESALRLEAVRGLRGGGLEEAAGLLEAVATRGSEEITVRREAVAGLAAFALARRSVLTELLADPEPAIGREAARSLRGLELEPAARARLEALEGGRDRDAPERGSETWRSALLEGGDRAEGELLFFHPRGPRCSSCHTVEGRGGIAGPDLSRSGRLGRKKLLDSILEPSSEIAPQYTTWTLVTEEGPRSGVLLGEEPDGGAFLLADGEGRVQAIPRAQVIAREPQRSSLMPENLAELMTFSELRDLLAYLEGLQ